MIKKCKYFPCHKDMDDCDMCYCFLYPCNILETGGKNIKGKNNEDIWDCSDCNIVHKKEFLDKLKPIFLEQLIMEFCGCNHIVNNPGITIKIGNNFLIKQYCDICKKEVYKKFKNVGGLY